MKKKIKIFVIVLMVLIVLMCVFNFVINRLKSNYRLFYKVSNEMVLEETYNTIFKKIDIRSNFCDINIKKSTDNTVKVIIKGDKEYINTNVKNNELFIEITKRNYLYFYKQQKTIANVEIYLPEGYSNLIEIENEYGNIFIDKLSKTDFDIENNYGDTKILSSDFVKLDIDHGNLIIEDAKMVRVNSLNGDINIGKVDDIAIEGEYGDIDIESVNEYLNIINDSGDVNIDSLLLEKDSFIKNNFGDINIEKTNQIYINAKTSHGDSKVKNNYKESEIILKIENNNGDIQINND